MIERQQHKGECNNDLSFYSFQAGRNNLAKLCRDLLSSSRVSSDFTEPVTRVYASVQPNANARIQDIAEIIAELREPLMYGEKTVQKPANSEVAESGVRNKMVPLQFTFYKCAPKAPKCPVVLRVIPDAPGYPRVPSSALE